MQRRCERALTPSAPMSALIAFFHAGCYIISGRLLDHPKTGKNRGLGSGVSEEQARQAYYIISCE